MRKSFDLNIERVLENWEISHAIREIIANALDEQILTNTASIKIFRENNYWVIRDYGRGLQYKHLTQNENEEKLKASNLIGKFGVGLKDALATFNRHGITVKIQSRYGIFSFGKMKKAGFDDIVTLHAIIDEPFDTRFIGTEFQICGCSEQDINAAKDMFLYFSSPNLLEHTNLGEVYKKDYTEHSKIYINGILVAQEDNFIFSYNITALTAQIKKAINRERTNVGRTAYTSRIKEILLKCKNRTVLKALADDLNKSDNGDMADELKWNDVAIHAAKVLNSQENIIFITSEELLGMSSTQKEILDLSGKEYVVVPKNVLDKLRQETDFNGNQIQTANTIYNDYFDSFEYKFVPRNTLSQNEMNVLKTSEWVFRFFGASNYRTKLAISETTCPTRSGHDVVGVWDKSTQKIIIRRDQLKSDKQFLGVLIHELVHAITGYDDVTRNFETALTDKIGELASALVS